MKLEELFELKMRGLPVRYIVGCLMAACLAVTIASHLAVAQSYVGALSRNEAPFADGESLKYKVSWGFLNLGTVEASQAKLRDTSDNIYCVFSRARSAPWLPFVNVNVVDSALLRTDPPSNVWFRFVDSTSKSWAIYSHDSNSAVLSMKGVDKGKDTVTRTVEWKTPCYNALGFLMLIRTLSGSGLDVRVPVIVDYDLKPTEIIFHRKIEAIKVAACKEPVPAYRFETKGNWSDRYSDGTNANMTGWVSADSAAVPLLFKMKILVGNIDVELESYVRPGWIPPTNSHLAESGAVGNRRNK